MLSQKEKSEIDKEIGPGMFVNSEGVKLGEGLAVMAGEIKPVIGKIVESGDKFMYHNQHMELARFQQ